ncbi:PREDICTED: ly6/PLAUR domain-containing protein 6B [Eufriesea mexicana]|uniref:ly6/PLAUR domain-containing protein 6B n=1 Tax=Eufriesea mexicana TaxID=516756 RepID=UPI00083C5F2B|nr:PREDICTED: ly6/PLAUR domain-containing protein 6B [Eufriesea mexicana]
MSSLITMKLSKIHWTLFIVCCLPFSHALECYVCTNQEGNREKCLRSTKICEQGQDTCFTEIRWGSTPYWSQGARKQFYVSKKCATKKECERIKHSNMKDCTYISYQDWKCSDCCQGDKCNYYVISMADKVHSYWLIVTASLITLHSVNSWIRIN